MGLKRERQTRGSAPTIREIRVEKLGLSST